MLILLFTVFISLFPELYHPEFQIQHQPNEEILYNLKMGFVKIGEGTIKLKNDTTTGMAFLEADVQTTGIIKVLYDARYYYSADMDKSTGLPFKANKILHEGKFHSENELLFDRSTRKDSCIVHSQLSGLKIFPMDVYDILTGFNRFRSFRLKKPFSNREQWQVKTCFSDREWDLKITYAGKEEIETIFGKTKCIKCYASTLSGPIFKNEDDFMIWFSDDARHLPVKFKADLKIGSFNVDLASYQLN